LVGSLLLGLFNETGALQHVGVCSSLPNKSGSSWWNILRRIAPDALAESPVAGWAGDGVVDGEPGQRMPGGQSRWSQGKDLSWEPLRPELVVEVAYEHMQGDRFVTWHISAGGAPIRNRAIVPTRNWK
jgi:hypothetical protein